MNDMVMFAEATTLTKALTPLWLVGVGSLVGLITLAVLWGIGFAVTRVGAIAAFASDRRRMLTTGLIISAVYAVLLLVLNFMSAEGLSTGVLIARAVTAVVIALFAGLSTAVLLSRAAFTEFLLAVREGPLFPLGILAAVLAAFGILATFLIAERPSDVIRSLPRLSATGETEYRQTIKAAVDDDLDSEGNEVGIYFRARELRNLSFEADQQMEVAFRPFFEVSRRETMSVFPDQPVGLGDAELLGELYESSEFDKVYVRNLGGGDAELVIKVVTAPEYGEVIAIPITAFAIVAIFFAYLLPRFYLPKMAAISLATVKSEVAQPVFYILLIVCSALLVVFIFVPYYTLGEDIKMLKITGLLMVLIVGVFVAVWAASKSVAEEIEGRTALTVLSKPVARREFILGKFSGIVWTLALLFVILGVVLFLCVSYKPVYDGREGSYEGLAGKKQLADITWQLCFNESVQIVPGLVLGFLEACIFAALSVAISTRLSMLPNFLICLSIYVLGHLTPLMVQSSVAVEAFEPVVFIGRLTATVLPVLDHFNIEAAIASDTLVPLNYMGWSFLYALIYSGVAMLLALVFFEDRDLT